jgi:hypothetical protein
VTTFIRYQSAVPNRHGRFPGVFALANGLRDDGRLDATEAQWLRAANDHANATYVDPTTVAPDCYDPVLNRGARSWFTSTAAELLEMTAPFLALLDRHDVPWAELRTRSPGRIVYEDAVQIVAVPQVYPADWPFTPSR